MPWIQTYRSKAFRLIDPRPESVCIEDIAHSLASVCRFGGHCDPPGYSVAQHCVHCADIVSEPYKLDALLHDAGEAYYGDFTRPVKLVLREMTAYHNRAGAGNHFDDWIRRIDRLVASVFRLSSPMPIEVVAADNIMLATEARDLMGPPPEPWVEMPQPLPHTVRPWPRAEALAQFMRIYHEYKRAA